MVAVKFLIEMVVILVALAVGLWWLFTNYTDITGEFFSFLRDIPAFSGG